MADGRLGRQVLAARSVLPSHPWRKPECDHPRNGWRLSPGRRRAGDDGAPASPSGGQRKRHLRIVSGARAVSSPAGGKPWGLFRTRLSFLVPAHEATWTSARVAELVDARDLGSRGLWPWGFESPLSHRPVITQQRQEAVALTDDGPTLENKGPGRIDHQGSGCLALTPSEEHQEWP